MGSLKTVTLEGASVDDRAAADLLNISYVDHAFIDHFRTENEQRRTTCVAVIVGSERVGTMLISFVDEAGERVCFCNALYVRPQVDGFDPVPDLIALVREWAAKVQATRLRFWTHRPGLVRKCEELGFKTLYVMEAPING